MDICDGQRRSFLLTVVHAINDGWAADSVCASLELKLAWNVTPMAMLRVLVAAAVVVVSLSSCGNPASTDAAKEKSKRLAARVELNDVVTQHGDPQRTGATLVETRLTPDRVHDGSFGRLFEWKVDGQIYAQPLYVSNLKYGDRRINVVVVATTNNSVYAFEGPSVDSDLKPSDTPLWHVPNSVLGTPLPFNFFWMPSGIFGYNIYPQIGITATPVIDRDSQTVYVTVKSSLSPTSSDGSGHVKYELVALNLLNGQIKARSAIRASYNDAEGRAILFDTTTSLQRAGLLEANGRIYMAFGSHQDTTPYHGWVIAYDASNLKYVSAYCTTCLHKPSSGLGGIWQAGAGPALDDTGNLYVISGNGSYGKKPADTPPKIDTGTSFIKLDKDLNVVGSWTPATFACLNRTDTDLGSAGPTFLSRGSALIGGGKEGVLYAIQSDAFRGVQVGAVISATGNGPPCEGGPRPAANGAGYSSIRATPRWKMDGIMDWLRRLVNPLAAQGFHHIHGSPVQWTVTGPNGDQLLLYVSGERDVLRAFEYPKDFSTGPELGATPQDSFESVCKNSDHGMPGGFLTLSANGKDPQSGIVWASMPRYNKNALTGIVPGVLRAYKAYPEHGTTKLIEIWNSDSGGNITLDCAHEHTHGPDQVGLFAKFVPPTVAEGKVYLSTFSGMLAVYGLKKPGGVENPAVANKSFDAQLQIHDLPPSADAGTPVAVSIRATNTGGSTWHPSDGIRLSSQLVPGEEYTEIDGKDLLGVQRDVAPGESYSFNFHLAARNAEAVHYFSWRLLRTGGLTRQPGGDWFGDTTEERRVMILRPGCNPIRERARSLIDRMRSSALRANVIQSDPATESEIESLQQEAHGADCSLAAELIEPMEPE